MNADHCSVNDKGICVTYMMYGLRLDEARMIVAQQLSACDFCRQKATELIQKDAAQGS